MSTSVAACVNLEKGDSECRYVIGLCVSSNCMVIKILFEPKWQ